MVTYKIGPKSGRGHLHVVFIYWRFQLKALTGKILVFWIGGRLWEVVAHGGSTVLEN